VGPGDEPRGQIHPDGARLASAGRDQAIWLWNFATGYDRSQISITAMIRPTWCLTHVQRQTPLIDCVPTHDLVIKETDVDRFAPGIVIKGESKREVHIRAITDLAKRVLF
jgi:hypothetical protein